MHNNKETGMTWMTPTFEEIDLSCEINSYASATL
jgi:coenzyme PQQ precursor peptide PqqA